MPSPDESYSPFEGIVLADTFQITEADDSFDAVVFPQNNERINRELATPIHVIVGNPPYSVGQTSANDLNANVSYTTLDGRIADTYAKRSTGTRKSQLYDSYVRAFRWATDRVGDDGIVAFVSNGGWIDGNTADGIRLSLADEYSRIYVYNLRGNQRAAGELSRKEGGKVFGSGSRNTVAVFIGVKNSAAVGSCEIAYRDIGDYLDREEKLRIIGTADLTSVEWRRLEPNAHGDWTASRSADFSEWPSMGGRNAALTVFAEYTLGLSTNRDPWVYNFSSARLRANVERLVANYNSELAPFRRSRVFRIYPVRNEKTVSLYLEGKPESAREDFVKWSRGLRADLARGVALERREDAVRAGSYRPFAPQHVYFDDHLNEVTSKLGFVFPTTTHHNLGIVVTGPASHFEFTPFMTDLLPNLHVLDSAQFFSRWTYKRAGLPDNSLDLDVDAGEVDEHGYRRTDNITDAIVEHYGTALGVPVSKDDIFFSVYGQLHDPWYRETYAVDLRKMLPHIPTPSTRERFDQLAEAGRALADLHVNYESVEPYPLDVQLMPGADPTDRETWRVTKMKWKTRGDHTTIAYNPSVTITGIPEAAERYQLGSRSALGWVIDRWQRKVDKASGIVNDPNDWCDEHDDPQYIVMLIGRITTVALETMAIVDRLVAVQDSKHNG